MSRCHLCAAISARNPAVCESPDVTLDRRGGPFVTQTSLSSQLPPALCGPKHVCALDRFACRQRHCTPSCRSLAVESAGQLSFADNALSGCKQTGREGVLTLVKEGPACDAGIAFALLCRDCLCPVVLTRGADQNPVSTKFDLRSDPVRPSEQQRGPLPPALKLIQ